MRKLIIKLELNFIIKLVCADNYDVAEVVPTWHDFCMTGQQSCQVGTTSV